ncbi:hypothetical protein SESBI_03265 [Sesbania bispinosa]|nr:hypothetical protein SESBI_03265 [Sesbania bispinosa]
MKRALIMHCRRETSPKKSTFTLFLPYNNENPEIDPKNTIHTQRSTQPNEKETEMKGLLRETKQCLPVQEREGGCTMNNCNQFDSS